MADEAFALFQLTVGQDVLFALIRIFAVLEHEPNRCADQLEAFTEEIFKVASIAFR